MYNARSWTVFSAGLAGLALGGLQACGTPDPPLAAQVQTLPVYARQTGRLEQLTQDRNGDGKVDMRGFMEGTHIKSAEIDRNFDGTPDRWEYYDDPEVGVANPGAQQGGGLGLGLLIRADESNGRLGQVTRRETYEHGLIHRVVEDANGDGRDDKWEYYEGGGLVRTDLDMQGWGVPDRRLIYGKNGRLDHLEMLPPPPGMKKRGG